MAAATDMMSTLKLISDFWPDLQFTKQDLVTANTDFIIRFYSKFIAEVNEKISYVINEENINDEFGDIQQFDNVVILYCRVAKLMKKIKTLQSLNLADFYCPNPKKMYTCVKFSIHFVIYINNFVDEIYNILNENFEKVSEYEKFKVLKEECLQEMADNSEHKACLEDSLQTLTENLEEAKKMHEKMLAEKVFHDDDYSERTAEANALQSENESLEYELKLLQDEEEDLEGCIITENDYESLKNTEKYLKIEQERLCNDHGGTDYNIDASVENANKLEEYAKKLAGFLLDSLNVENLCDIREQVATNENTQNKVNDDLNTLIETKNATEMRMENLKCTLEKTQLSNASLRKKIITDEEHEAKCVEREIQKCSSNFEECQRLETEFYFKDKDIKEIGEDERILNATVAREYARILNMEKKTTNKFYNMLVKMKRDGDNATI